MISSKRKLYYELFNLENNSYYMKSTIIIAGAGAAGLMAAYELSKKGFLVIVAEASERTGGRIHTLYNSFYNSKPEELGAEFMHGKLPITMELLKEAGTSYELVKGKMYRIQQGQWQDQEEIAEGWDELFEKMKSLKTDLTLTDFLQQYFYDPRYELLRRSVRKFAEGFDIADPDAVSTFSLRDEWMNDPEKQYHIKGGYRLLIDHLEKEITHRAGQLLTNCKVTDIHWSSNHVQVKTSDGRTLQGQAVLLAVPLPVLQNTNAERGICFTPPIPHIPAEARKIGWGKVIKFHLKFAEPLGGEKDTGFILSEETVPTWWTQFPGDTTHITGWLGGPDAEQYEQKSDQELLSIALYSLAKIVGQPVEAISKKLKAYVISNWGIVPNIQGGYSYNTPESLQAKSILKAPIEETIFLAGEAIHTGASTGTVEAALASGREAAERLIRASILE